MNFCASRQPRPRGLASAVADSDSVSAPQSRYDVWVSSSLHYEQLVEFGQDYTGFPTNAPGAQLSLLVVHTIPQIVEWVRRMKIVRPSAASWGIFFNPDSQQVDFFPAPRPSAVFPPKPKISLSALPQYDDRNLTGMNAYHRQVSRQAHLPLSEEVVARSPVATFKSSGKRQTVQGKIVAVERKYSVDGLHYVRMITSSNINPDGGIETCPRLLVDTGCPITWLYHPEVKELDIETKLVYDKKEDDYVEREVPRPTNIPLARTSQARYYSSIEEATRVMRTSTPNLRQATYSQYVKFCDKFTAGALTSSARDSM
uniref:Uncharacterized protein n=1 Tax=Mycena chlorophos TaxID=658473 RepID=A0ABQ0LPU1_MYCCL|nr:predicted protein [Mycena chlorophos]